MHAGNGGTSDDNTKLMKVMAQFEETGCLVCERFCLHVSSSVGSVQASRGFWDSVAGHPLKVTGPMRNVSRAHDTWYDVQDILLTMCHFAHDLT